MAGITHATVASGTDAGTGEIHKAEWNAAHTTSGLYELLSSQTLGADAADITFTSLSQAYKDLVLVIVARSTWASHAIDDIYTQVGNGSIDTTSSNYYNFSNYSGTGSGSVTSGVGIWSGVGAAPTMTANYFSSHTVEIIDYTSTSKVRHVLLRSFLGDGSTVYRVEGAATWKNTSQAIDQVKVYAGNGNLLAGSKVSVYGRG